jgi:protein SCO1/2
MPPPGRSLLDNAIEVRTLFALVLLLALAACHREPATKDYAMHGVIVRLDIPSKLAVINAEKVDGWMEAMTMEYPVHDPKLLEGLEPGDHISATVHVRDDMSYWIDRISK